MALAVDPVCGALVDQVAADGNGLVSAFARHQYRFCSAACRQQFERHRDTYVVTRDVVCGTEIDPNIADLRSLGRTHGNRRFRFCSRDCLEQFMEDPTRYAHQIPPAESAPLRPAENLPQSS